MNTLESLRRRRGATYRDMAADIGVSQQAALVWCKGRSRPQGLSVPALEKWAGLPVDALLTPKVEEPPTPSAEGSEISTPTTTEE